MEREKESTTENKDKTMKTTSRRQKNDFRERNEMPEMDLLTMDGTKCFGSLK